MEKYSNRNKGETNIPHKIEPKPLNSKNKNKIFYEYIYALFFKSKSNPGTELLQTLNMESIHSI